MATSWQIGDVTVTKIVEGDLPVRGRHLLPDATDEALDEIEWLRPNFRTGDGLLNLSIHALVVDTPTARLLVDTCVGNDKERSNEIWHLMNNSFLDDLAGAGFPAESIDYVICTHLHVDHVGWNTRLVDGEWVPTFPNARYLFGRTEWESWRDEVAKSANGAHGNDTGVLDVESVMADSITPILDAGLADLVDVDHRVCDTVYFESTPGHTAGHISVHISSRGEDAVITGDMTHHPCQIARPEWSSWVDHDASQSARTRQEFYAKYADQPTLIIGTHFAPPTAGHIVTGADGYEFR